MNNPPAPLPDDDKTALRVDGLRHAWGAKPALRDVSFAVGKGRFTALLGPNGAGKSTLISALTGLIRPAPGIIQIGGYCINGARQKALAQIGVVFQQPTLDLDATVRANMRYFAALHGLPRAIAETRIEDALTRLGMFERIDEKLRALNGGHRRRMEIARALIHRPALLLLDEPTVGLDASARLAITNHVHDLAASGLAVLWATHLTDEIRPSDDLILLHKGEIRAQGRVENVTQGPLTDWFLEATC